MCTENVVACCVVTYVDTHAVYVSPTLLAADWKTWQTAEWMCGTRIAADRNMATNQVENAAEYALEQGSSLTENREEFIASVQQHRVVCQSYSADA